MIPARDPGNRQLAGIAGAAIFVACLALAVAAAASDTTQRWRDALARALTVEIAPGPAAAAQADDAASRLAALPGVAAAERLSARHVATLIAPWLGGETRLDDLPLPILIDLRLTPAGAFDADAARDVLAAVAPGARLDDHRAWRDAVARLGWLAVGLAGAVALAATAGAVLAVMLATRARLAVHQARIEILHLMGARDFAVAGAFARGAMAATATGGACGLALATSLVVVARRAADAGLVEPLGSLPLPDFGVMHWTLLILPLPACTLLAGVTAAWTVHAALRRLP